MTIYNRTCICGGELGDRRNSKCEACQEAAHKARIAEWEREDVVRPRDVVEKYVEALMQKHSVDSDSLTPRQHLALDRKLTQLYKRLCAVEHGDFNEFKALTFGVAFKLGLLQPERWQWFRHVRVHSEKYRGAVVRLWHGVCGNPAHWQPDAKLIRRDFILQALPVLRARIEKPDTSPIIATMPASIKEESPTRDTEIETKSEKLIDMFALMFYAKADNKRQAYMRSLWKKNGLTHLLDTIGYHPDEVDTLEQEPINPEQVDAANQDAIDAQFYSLMEGSDL